MNNLHIHGVKKIKLLDDSVKTQTITAVKQIVIETEKGVKFAIALFGVSKEKIPTKVYKNRKGFF